MSKLQGIYHYKGLTYSQYERKQYSLLTGESNIIVNWLAIRYLLFLHEINPSYFREFVYINEESLCKIHYKFVFVFCSITWCRPKVPGSNPTCCFTGKNKTPFAFAFKYTKVVDGLLHERLNPHKKKPVRDPPRTRHVYTSHGSAPDAADPPRTCHEPAADPLTDGTRSGAPLRNRSGPRTRPGPAPTVCPSSCRTAERYIALERSNGTRYQLELEH